MPDIELGTRESLQGFSVLAACLSSDSELAVFRKFDKLGTRDLLYMQSELIHLESEFSKIEAKEEKRGQGGFEQDERNMRCWEELADDAKRGGDIAKVKMDLIKDIRTLMREYRQALMLQSQITSLPKPPKRVMFAFREWVKEVRPLAGDSRPVLETSDDFLSLDSSEKDRLTRVLLNYMGHVLPDQKTAGDFDPVGMKKTSRGVVEGIVTTLSIVIPAFLLLGGIAVLYFESRQGAKLGLAAVFTFLFAASVALLTSAKRVEVFGASAAYAAVLVVYLTRT